MPAARECPDGGLLDLVSAQPQSARGIASHVGALCGGSPRTLERPPADSAKHESFRRGGEAPDERAHLAVLDGAGDRRGVGTCLGVSAVE